MVNITGGVEHLWYDDYDWHANLTAYVPGFGPISDADALLVQRCRGAKPFRMEATWKQTMTGSVEVRRFLPDPTTFDWKGP